MSLHKNPFNSEPMDYADIILHCDVMSAISREVIDNFLIYYAAEKERLEPRMDALLKKHRNAVREIPKSYVNMIKSEYIAHLIFREGGYLTKYMDRKEFKSLPPEQFKFLEYQLRYPWRFSFAVIIDSPSEAFFNMQDVMTGERYLLYSPGMKATLDEETPLLWFNLIGFNGQCWQTFGLVMAYKSLSVDDIFFFATELNPQVEDEDSLMEAVDSNSMPFLLLISKAHVPPVISRGHEVLFFQSKDFPEVIPWELLSDDFKINRHKGVLQLVLKTLDPTPHFAVAYYHETKHELIRTAMTEAGFNALTQALVKAGIVLDPMADVLVSPGMLSAAAEILNRRILLNPYEDLFAELEDMQDSKELGAMNHFLELAIPHYNAGTEPDIRLLAEQANLDYETALDLWNRTKVNLDDSMNKASKDRTV